MTYDLRNLDYVAQSTIEGRSLRTVSFERIKEIVKRAKEERVTKWSVTQQ